MSKAESVSQERNDQDPDLTVPRRGIQRFMGDEDPEGWCPTPVEVLQSTGKLAVDMVACAFPVNPGSRDAVDPKATEGDGHHEDANAENRRPAEENDGTENERAGPPPAKEDSLTEAVPLNNRGTVLRIPKKPYFRDHPVEDGCGDPPSKLIKDFGQLSCELLCFMCAAAWGTPILSPRSSLRVSLTPLIGTNHDPVEGTEMEEVPPYYYAPVPSNAGAGTAAAAAAPSGGDDAQQVGASSSGGEDHSTSPGVAGQEKAGAMERSSVHDSPVGDAAAEGASPRAPAAGTQQ